MDRHSSPPLLDFFRRRDCAVCDEVRLTLQQVLEDRVLRGDPVPVVRYVDVDEQDSLRQRYGALVPVLAIDGQELSLAVGYRQIARFLDAAIGRLA